jgi:hypothetical protein
MNDEDRSPDVPQALIDYLQKRYQLAAPSVNDTLSQIQRAAGQQDVITALINLRAHRTEDEASSSQTK